MAQPASQPMAQSIGQSGSQPMTPPSDQPQAAPTYQPATSPIGDQPPATAVGDMTDEVPTLPSLINAENDSAAIEPVVPAMEPAVPTVQPAANHVMPAVEASIPALVDSTVSVTPTTPSIPAIDTIPVQQATDLDADGLPDLPGDLKPGSMAPMPEETPETMQVDLNEFSPGELNSLSIDPVDPQADQVSAVSPTDRNKVGLEIDENGVKTITGPKLTPAPMNLSTAPVVLPNIETPKTEISETEAPIAGISKAETPKVTVNSGEQLQASASIEEIMALAEQKKASDIHFAANYPIMLRVDGRLAPFSPRLSGVQTAELAKQLLNEQRQQKFAESKELDFSFTNANQTRFRVNLFTERDNVAGALRLIEKNIRTMKELDLPDVLFEIVDEPHGLVLVVGPTGSGKSTTLAAMLNHINLNRADHILTIEDPIEYVYPQEMSIVNQREVGADTHAWQAALKSALREDPDVVLVGEMRDLDTIESTITIAETGHLTFATLHTNSAAQAIDRIIDVFPEGSKEQIRAQLANVITAVVSQRLIPVQTGGRRAALEVMLGTVAVRNAIREGKTYQIDNIIQTSGDLGMITLEKSLVNLVKKGYISKDVAKAHSAKPDEIDSLLNNLRL